MPTPKQQSFAACVREEVLQYGPDSVSDARLLALLLGLDLASTTALLARLGSLREVYRCGAAELCSIRGIGPHRAATLKALAALGSRIATQPLERGRSYTNSQDVYKAYGPMMTGLEREEFWCLLLDTRNRLLKEVRVAVGSINRCPVSPQDIFAPALREKAVKLLLIHNHPTGVPEPSNDDKDLTRRLVGISELLNVEIVDHLVIGDGRYVSFVDRGWL